MAVLRDVIENLEDIGVFSVAIPFILIYAIVYAILEKSNVFSKKEGGEQKKNGSAINAIVSFAIALISILSIKTVELINSLVVKFVVFIISAILILIVLASFFGESYKNLFVDENNKIRKKIVFSFAGVILAVSVIIIIVALDLWEKIQNFIGIDPGSFDFVTLFVVILIISALVFVSRDSNSKSDS